MRCLDLDAARRTGRTWNPKHVTFTVSCSRVGKLQSVQTTEDSRKKAGTIMSKISTKRTIVNSSKFESKFVHHHVSQDIMKPDKTP